MSLRQNYDRHNMAFLYIFLHLLTNPIKRISDKKYLLFKGEALDYTEVSALCEMNTSGLRKGIFGRRKSK